jgi:hypothetical protein
MAGHVFSEIFHPGDDRMIVRWQTGDDLRKVAVDASRALHLKNTAIVENSHVSWMKCTRLNGSLTIKIWQPNLGKNGSKIVQEKWSVNAAVERLERQLNPSGDS